MLKNFIDTHCHLDLLSDSKNQIINAKKKGVDQIIVPSIDTGNFSNVKKLANENDGVFYSVGIHPCRINNVEKDDLFKLEKFLIDNQNDPKLVAIGEIGLDFFIKGLDKDKMLHIYIEQLKIAKRFSLPVLLHVRKAQDLVFKYLSTFQIKSGIAHAFNGSHVQAKRFISAGILLGFGGVLTYERSLQIRRLAQLVPDNSYVLETDSPDLIPNWLDPGVENTPSEIPKIASCLAKLRKQTVSDIKKFSSENAHRIFPKMAKYG